MPWPTGRKRTEEEKARIREHTKATRSTPEQRALTSQRLRARPPTSEKTRHLLSARSTEYYERLRAQIPEEPDDETAITDATRDRRGPLSVEHTDRVSNGVREWRAAHPHQADPAHARTSERRVELYVATEAKLMLRELAQRWYPETRRADSKTLERLIREAYTREIEQQGEGAKHA